MSWYQDVERKSQQFYLVLFLELNSEFPFNSSLWPLANSKYDNLLNWFESFEFPFRLEKFASPCNLKFGCKINLHQNQSTSFSFPIFLNLKHKQVFIRWTLVNTLIQIMNFKSNKIPFYWWTTKRISSWKRNLEWLIEQITSNSQIVLIHETHKVKNLSTWSKVKSIL